MPTAKVTKKRGRKRKAKAKVVAEEEPLAAPAHQVKERVLASQRSAAVKR